MSWYVYLPHSSAEYNFSTVLFLHCFLNVCFFRQINQQIDGDESNNGSKSDNGKGSSLKGKDKPLVESKEFGDNEKKSGKVDTGESNKAKSKNENIIVGIGTDEDMYDSSDSKDGGFVNEEDTGKKMKASRQPGELRRHVGR